MPAVHSRAEKLYAKLDAGELKMPLLVLMECLLLEVKISHLLRGQTSTCQSCHRPLHQIRRFRQRLIMEICSKECFFLYIYFCVI